MSIITVALPFSSLDPQTELAYVVSPDGRTALQQGQAPLGLLPKADRTCLVVPAQRLAFHLVDYPIAPKGRLRAALEGLLEDQLLVEPSTLALAVAPGAQAKAPTWVASLDKAWLLATVAAFEQAGHHVSRVIPQAWPQSTPVALAEGSPDAVWIIRSNPQGVLRVPLAHARVMIEQDEMQPVVVCTPDLSSTIEAVLGLTPELQSKGAMLLRQAQTEWDLTQFDVSVGHAAPWQRQWTRRLNDVLRQPRWRPFRWGAIGLLIANLVGLNVVAWQEQTALNRKKAIPVQLLQRTFAQVKVVIDPAAQMQRELAVLRATSASPSPSDLEFQLSALGSALSMVTADAVAFRPTELAFAQGSTSLTGVTLNGPAQALVVSRLSQQQIKAEPGANSLRLSASAP